MWGGGGQEVERTAEGLGGNWQNIKLSDPSTDPPPFLIGVKLTAEGVGANWPKIKRFISVLQFSYKKFHYRTFDLYTLYFFLPISYRNKIKIIKDVKTLFSTSPFYFCPFLNAWDNFRFESYFRFKFLNDIEKGFMCNVPHITYKLSLYADTNICTKIQF